MQKCIWFLYCRKGKIKNKFKKGEDENGKCKHSKNSNIRGSRDDISSGGMAVCKAGSIILCSSGSGSGNGD